MRVAMTAAQVVAVERLERKGWDVVHADDDTVYFSRRGKLRGETWLAQVGPDGVVEGHEAAK